MRKFYQKMKKQTVLVGAICGSLLIALPAMAMPRMANDKTLAKVNSSTFISTFNPHSGIFDEPLYNRPSTILETETGTLPMTQTIL